MGGKTLYIFIPTLLAIIAGCYPKVSVLSSLPSTIDYSLIGEWKIKSVLIDVGTTTQVLEFNANREVYYKQFYNDYLSVNLSGEYRVDSDTLYILFNSKISIEIYTYKINDNKMLLRNLREENNPTIEKYLSRDPNWYRIY